MPDQLQIERYTPEKSALVADFFFGTADYEKELENWIKGDEVIEALNRNTEVLIYLLDGKPIGFGSIGYTERPWPPEERKAEKLKVSVIPAVAILPEFQGQPREAAKEERYSHKAFMQLLLRAKALGNPTLILYVHPENKRAIAFYQQYGFVDRGASRDAYRIMSVNLVV